MTSLTILKFWLIWRFYRFASFFAVIGVSQSVINVAVPSKIQERKKEKKNWSV